MVLYLLGRDDVAIKEVKTISSYEIKEDIDFNDSSNIVLADYVHMDDGDFALIKDGAEQAFFGICKEMKSSDSGYKITLKQKENLFDTTIFNDGEELIQSTGIEDYIVKAISDNFISSGDALMDMDYIQISASTHTLVAAKVSTIVDVDNGVYNLKTFLGNARQNYGIFLDFTVENRSIKIDVNCREQTVLNVDTKLPEVADVSEIYSVSVLAKLVVKWDKPKEYATTEEVKEADDALKANIDKKAPLEKPNIKNPTLNWYIGDRDVLTDYVQLRQAGANDATTLSLVYYDTVTPKTVFNNLIGTDGTFLPEFSTKQHTGTLITNTVSAKTWTNIRSLTLSSGTYLIVGELGHTSAGNHVTFRLIYDSVEYMKATAYAPDSVITHTGCFSRVITLTASKTIYLQAYASAALTIGISNLFATKLR